MEYVIGTRPDFALKQKAGSVSLAGINDGIFLYAATEQKQEVGIEQIGTSLEWPNCLVFGHLMLTISKSSLRVISQRSNCLSGSKYFKEFGNLGIGLIF